MMMPFCTATPKSAMKPTPLATFRVWPVRCSEIRPPSVASGTTPRISSAWRMDLVPNVRKISIMPMTSAEDDQQPRLGAPLVLELAAPFEVHAARIEVHLRGDLPLRVLEVARQVPVAVVDADGEVALAVLARDRCSRRSACGWWRPATAAPARR